jgi:hypothetical protein
MKLTGFIAKFDESKNSQYAVNTAITQLFRGLFRLNSGIKSSSIVKMLFEIHTFLVLIRGGDRFMVKVLKVTTHFVLILGLIVLSFRPSVSTQIPLRLSQPQQAASHLTMVSKQMPLSARSTARRCNFQKTENKYRFQAGVASVPMVDIFDFNAPRLNRGTTRVPFVAAFSSLKTSVLRI